MFKELFKFFRPAPKTPFTMPPSAALFPSLDSVAESDSVSRRKGAVLLVEDEATLAELLTHLLTRVQVEVIHAASGTVAMQIFKERRESIALAFVDCHLPDMDGRTVCQQLRSVAPGLPLLLTSGRDQRTLEAVFAASGPTGYLPKPYMPGEVLRRVTMLLNASA